MNQTAKFLPKLDSKEEAERILQAAPEPVDPAAETIDIRPPLSAPPANPGLNHEELAGAPIDEIRFRLTRHRVEQLENIDLHLAFFDSDGRLLRTPVRDFSERGIGIACPKDLIVRSGELLRNVEVHAGLRCVYRGEATVIHHPNQPERLGMKLSGTGLDVSVLLQQDQRAGQLVAFERHLIELKAHLSPSSLCAEYRSLIADLVTLLAGLKAETEAMEAQVAWVDLGTAELQHIENLIGDDFVRLTDEMNRVTSCMDSDEIDIAAQYAKRLLHPLLLCAPIPARAYEKPLGYAGDYQLMELIYRQRDATQTLFTKLVNRLCCRLPAAKAVVARVDLLTDLLQEEIQLRHGQVVRIGSMACGPAEEIQRLLNRSLPRETPVEVALIDQDHEALTYCSRRMLQVESKARTSQELSLAYFQTSVKTMVTNPAELDSLLGKFDILYTVGLFDYLAAPAARAMLKSMSRFLAPQGVLIVGNFCRHEGQAFMEQVLDWRLLYREKDELRRLAQTCHKDMGGDFEIEVLAEENQTHLFLVMRKQ